MPDTDILEEGAVDETVESTGQEQDEHVEIPEHAAGESKDRDALIAEAMDEGVAAGREEEILDDLGNVEKHPEMTVELLRQIPGAEDLTDAEIVAEWNRQVAIAQSGQAGGEFQAGQAAKFEIPFPVYDAQGNKLTTDKVTLEDLVSGKVQLGYNALGKEQRKTLTEALRNASQGHWNEQKYSTAVQERNALAQQLQVLREQTSQFDSQRKVWDAALTALNMGNAEPMKKLAQDYQRALTSQGPASIPGMVSIEQVRQEQEQSARGMAYMQNVIVPFTAELAKRYDANQQQILQETIKLLQQEPPEFLTEAKIQSILQYEIPAILERNGYSEVRAGQQVAQTSQPTDEIAQLKQTVAALQERIAGKQNETTQRTREKSKNRPPAGGGAVPSAGDSMPSFKSRSQFKAWSQGDPDWAKA